MTVSLSSRAQRYLEAANRLHEIELSGQPETERLAAIKPLLIELAAQRDLFPLPAFPRAPGTPGGLFRLVEFPDQRGALYMSLGYTGRINPPHTHASWALVAGVSGGVEHNVIYERVDDGSVDGEAELRLYEDTPVGPGQIGVVATGHYHTIEVVSDEPVLHLHAYGHAVDAPGFSLPAFDSPESRTYKLRTSGAFQPPLAFATLDEAADDIAVGRAILISGDEPTLAGPYVLQADAATVVERLDAANAPKDAPVVVIGDDAGALAVAKALYAAGRPLVFQLAAESSERLAA